MPSCTVPYFVHKIVKNPLAAIQIHRQHRDYAAHIDPSTGNGHLHSYQYNEHSTELPKFLETFVSDTCHSYIRAEFYSRVCTAKQESVVAQR